MKKIIGRHNVNEIFASPDSSCEHIIVPETLDYIEDRNKYLGVVIKKLRYGGRIELDGVDLYEVSRAVMLGILDIPQASILLHDGKVSTDYVINMIKLIESNGLTILHVRLENFRYFIMAERNKNVN